MKACKVCLTDTHSLPLLLFLLQSFTTMLLDCRSLCGHEGDESKMAHPHKTVRLAGLHLRYGRSALEHRNLLHNRPGAVPAALQQALYLGAKGKLLRPACLPLFSVQDQSTLLPHGSWAPAMLQCIASGSNWGQYTQAATEGSALCVAPMASIACQLTALALEAARKR